MAQRFGMYLISAFFIASVVPAHADDSDALPRRRGVLVIKQAFSASVQAYAGFQEGDKKVCKSDSAHFELSLEKPWVTISPNTASNGKNAPEVRFEKGEKYTVSFASERPNARYHVNQVSGGIMVQGQNTAKASISVSIPTGDSSEMPKPKVANFEQATKDWMELKLDDAEK